MPQLASANEWQQASEVIEQTTRDILAITKADKNQQLAQVLPQMAVKLNSVVDFQAIAKGVMAKHYRHANTKQFDDFVEVLRHSLVSSYVTVMMNFSVQSFTIQPNPGEDTRVGREKIWVKVYTDRGQYDIHYTMSLRESDWKLTNVVLDGVNLGLAFRQQFSSAMVTAHNDMDTVIANWLKDSN
jgi:phospholipid transport system substrate-binding protein